MDKPAEIIDGTSQWFADDIQDFLRGMIRSKLGGYYSNNHKYLLIKKPNIPYILITPSISTFEQDISFDFFLNKNQQGDPQATDVFDELMPLLNVPNGHAKILFSFNLHNLHWSTCEINIVKTNNIYVVTVFSHDPYGGGELDGHVFDIIRIAIINGIKSHHPASDVVVTKEKSPYSARQNPEDGSSCGVISTRDIIKIIQGESINQLSTYSIGALELRQEFLSQLDDLDISLVCKQRIRTSNTIQALNNSNKKSKKTTRQLVFHPTQEESSSSYTSSEDTTSTTDTFYARYFNFKNGYPFEIKDDEAGDVNLDSSEESSSSGSEEDEDQMVTNDEQKPGYVLNIPSVANGSKNTLIAKIQNTLFPQAFHATPDESVQETKYRLRINIGFNRMQSISKKKNRTLQKTVDSAREEMDGEKTNAFGFFWVPKWFDKIKKQPVTIKRVRSWYKALKGKKPNEAKKAVTQLESKITSDMIPYTKIREKVKKNKRTKSFVRKLRTNERVNHVYLASFDDDFVSLRYAQTGLFSEYDRLIAEHEAKQGKPPQVLTTGYLVSSAHIPIIEVAVKLDMCVRNATSKFFKNAVYFCEPNTIIYVKPDEETIEASFILNNKSCKNEMPTLMANLIKKRSLNPDNCFVFYSSNAPLVTNMPTRMQYASKKSVRKVFTGQKTKEGKVLRFNYEDLKQLINTSQSHVKARDWANRIIACLIIPKSVVIDGCTLSRLEIISTLKSLLPRIFIFYNPIYTAKDRFKNQAVLVNKVNNYIYQLEHVCINYAQTLIFKKYTAKKSNNRDKLKNKQLIPLRKKLDDLDNINTVITYIGTLLNDAATAKNIHHAAQASGIAIRDELINTLSFDFPRIIYAMLTDFFQEFENEQVDYCEFDKLSNEMKSVLESLADNSFISKYHNKSLEELNAIILEHGLKLIHLAVLSGNKSAVKFLKQKGVSLYCESVNYSVYPLHLAILYCANHGNDLELLNLCIEKKQLSARLRNDFSPLMMALTMLDDPLPVVSLLCQHGALKKELHEPLFHIIRLSEGRELRTPLLACIHYLPKLSHLAIAMLENGADINQRGIIESKAYGQEPERQFTYPLCECITGENIELLHYLLKNGAQTTEIYDSEGRPPLIIAIHDTSHPVFFVKLLLRYNADLSESDLIEGTYPIHESISPLHSRYLAPGPNKQKYEDAFMETFRNLGQHPPAESSLFDYLLHKSTVDQLDLRDGNDDTPLEVALEIEDDVVIAKLISAGADTDYLDREEFEYIRENTEHKIYHSEEREEQADQQNMDLAEDAVAAEGIDLDTSDSQEIIRALNVLIDNAVDDPVETLSRLYKKPESDEAEEDSSESSSSSYKFIYDTINPNPLDFKYEDEENLDEEEVDYPDAPPSSNPQSPVDSFHDSYEMSEHNSGV